MYYLYIILCEDNSLYTGIAKNVERRFIEHEKGKGSKYTKAKKVKQLLYTEKYKTRSQASKREAQIKGWRRERKLNLIARGKL